VDQWVIWRSLIIPPRADPAACHPASVDAADMHRSERVNAGPKICIAARAAELWSRYWPRGQGVQRYRSCGTMSHPTRTEVAMVARLGRRDPHWDDGTGARRRNTRVRVEGLVAVILAIAACGLTAAMWIRQILLPLFGVQL
jgi:hypothetical protein